MSDPGFVHLHVHSSYSLLEGALTIAKLAELAKADRQPALALTDSDNMFGALEFSDKLAGSGIQPIIGCALSVDFGDLEAPRHPGHALKLPRLVLLAAREEGYRNLMRLTSQAFLDTPADQAGFGAALLLDAVALQLDIEPVAEQRGEPPATRRRKLGLARDEREIERPARASA